MGGESTKRQRRGTTAAGHDPRTDAHVAARWGVEVVRWPSESPIRSRLARANVPRLLLVTRAGRPPDPIGLDEDWTWADATATTVAALASMLRARVDHIVGEPAIVDDTGVLHRHDRTVALNATEAAVLRALLRRAGEVVARRDLEREIWPEGPPSATSLETAIYRLRGKLAGLLLAIDARRGRGFVLLPPSAHRVA